MKQPHERIEEGKDEDAFLVAAAAGGTRKKTEGKRGRRQLAAVSQLAEKGFTREAGGVGQLGQCTGGAEFWEAANGTEGKDAGGKF